ncbi:MAG TPA: bifunctional adenosylcobinamide kinase/adenosylcobinamide-phosphate guanylyltransferase [Acidimicrobiales bacterium]
MITLVLGGARSGKSEVAEAVLAPARGPVTYVATARGDDPTMASRIAAHRARRPASWRTVEAADDLPDVLRSLDGPVLVDSLGAWLAHCDDLVADVAGLCQALEGRSGPAGDATVLVSEEVGLGVHPPTEVGVRFADGLGEVNRSVADLADEVLFVVAGRVLPLARPAPYV